MKYAFDPPVSVTPGNTYYIVLYEQVGSTRYHESVGPPYTNGGAYYKNPGEDWVAGLPLWGPGDHDMPFQTLYLSATDNPVADAGPDIIAEANETVVLDGSASFDMDSTIVNYEWVRLPVAPILGAIYSGADPTCETEALGRVEEVIQLTVTDEYGATGTDTMKIINKQVQDLRNDVNRILRNPFFRFGYRPMGSQYPYIYRPDGKNSK